MTSKPAKQNSGCLGVIFIMIAVVIVSVSCGSNNDKSTPSSSSTEPSTTQTEFEKEWGKYFSGWDNSCIPLVKAVKADMNDPKSFEFVDNESIVESDNGNLIIVMTFRGKNGFGGIVTQGVAAELSPSGDIVSIAYKE